MANRRSRRHGGDDPVAQFREEARWSSYTNSWSRQFRGRGSKAKRFVFLWFGLVAAMTVVAGILASRD